MQRIRISLDETYNIRTLRNCFSRARDPHEDFMLHRLIENTVYMTFCIEAYKLCEECYKNNIPEASFFFTYLHDGGHTIALAETAPENFIYEDEIKRDNLSKEEIKARRPQSPLLTKKFGDDIGPIIEDGIYNKLRQIIGTGQVRKGEVPVIIIRCRERIIESFNAYDIDYAFMSEKLFGEENIRAYLVPRQSQSEQNN